MTRAQIQMPDQLHDRVRRLAEAHEWTFSEAMRRAAELLLRSYPDPDEPTSGWELPVVHVGEVLAPYEAFRELANERS